MARTRLELTHGERKLTRLTPMKLATSKMAPALRWFVVAWLMVTGVVLWLVSRNLPPVEASLPRSHDLVGSTLGSESPDVSPCGENERWVELAWIQLTPDGLEEALFGAGQVRVELDRPKPMLFRVPDRVVGEFKMPHPSGAFGAGNTRYGQSSIRRVVEVCWRGSKDGVAAIDVVSNDREHHEAVDMKFDSGQGLASIGTLVFAEEELALVPELRSGSVLLMRVTRSPGSGEDLARLDSWRKHASALANRLAEPPALAFHSVQKRGDRVDRNSPLLPIDPLASAATASLVFRDPELASCVHASRRELAADTTFNSEMARGDEAALVALVRGSVRDLKRFGDHEVELGVRGLLVQPDVASADAITEALKPRVRNFASGVWIVKFLEFEPPEPVADAWRDLRAGAASLFSPPWNTLFRWPQWIPALLLLPIVTALLLVFARRARAAEVPTLPLWTLIALALAQWLALENKDHAWLFALLFAGLAWRRLTAPIGALERALLALCLVGVAAAGWRSIGWMLDTPRASAFSLLSFSLSWFHVARWLHDGSNERVPLRLQLLLATHLLAMVCESNGFGRAWSGLEWPSPSALLLGLDAVLLAFYVSRLHGQRHGFRARSRNSAAGA